MPFCTRLTYAYSQGLIFTRWVRIILPGLFLLTLAALAYPGGADEPTTHALQVGTDGFTLHQIPLPHPRPSVFKSDHKSPWPRVTAKGKPQGYAIYPEVKEYLDLTFQDATGDGLHDLIYSTQRKRSLILDIFPQSPPGNFSPDKRLTIRISLTDLPLSSAPIFFDFNGDNRLDLLLISKHPTSPMTFSLRGQVKFCLWLAGDSEALLEHVPFPPEISEAPLEPLYLLKHRELKRWAVLGIQTSLSRPTKKGLSQYLFHGIIRYKVRLREISARGFRTVSTVRFDLSVHQQEVFEQRILNAFNEWEKVDLPKALYWERRISSRPRIRYDWTGDGSMDDIMIHPGERHEVWDRREDKLVKTFQLTRNNLVTGAYLDLDGDGFVEELDFQFLRLPGTQLPKSTDLSVNHRFQKNRFPEKYHVEGLVFFPQSFVDFDRDGDLDLITVKNLDVRRGVIAKLLRGITKNLWFELLVYERARAAFSQRPLMKRKVWRLKGLDAIHSYGDLL